MMHYSFTTLAAFAALGAASPVGVKQTFTVPQVEAGVTQLAPPAVAMLQTYLKYASAGAEAPAVVVKAAAAQQQTGSVTATPMAYDMAYLCPVTVGGQSLNLNFDTGSADLWVFSTLQSSSAQSGHSVYNPNNSGKRISGATWSISYGDGSGASGVVYSDKVVIGGATATAQAVEAATSVSSQFLSDTDSDGLVGLAFSSLNTVRPNQQTTFFDTVKSTLAKQLFTVDLKKGTAGTYDFGFIDSSKYTGDITYVDVDTSTGFWSFTVDGYAVGPNSIVSESYETIADTGTSLTYAPSDVVKAYYAQVSGSSYSSSSGGWIFPCSSSLPSWTAIIGGSKFTVPGSYMNYAQISNTACFGGLQPNTGIGFSIFGDIFLKSQFVVFSMVNSNNPQLGFAAQTNLAGVSDSDFEEWYYECDGSEVSS